MRTHIQDAGTLFGLDRGHHESSRNEIKGQLNGISVVIQIDRGDSHNFISFQNG